MDGATTATRWLMGRCAMASVHSFPWTMLGDAFYTSISSSDIISKHPETIPRVVKQWAAEYQNNSQAAAMASLMTLIAQVGSHAWVALGAIQGA